MHNIIDYLEGIKKNIYFMFVREEITFNDIDNLYNSNIDDLLKKIDSYKDKVLLSIYINPYLLCNDYLVRIDGFNVDIISRLLIKRYNEEVYEYNTRLMNGDITYIEYCNNIMMLNKLYFTSTMMGSRISKMNEDKIIKKVNRKKEQINLKR